MFRYQPSRKKDGIIIDQTLTGGRMLAGGTIQDVHEQSTIQNYDIGTRLVMDDRVFRYSKAGGNLVALTVGKCGVMPREGNCAKATYAVGTFKMTLPVNTQGDKATDEVKKDYWKEGYIWIQTEPKQLIRIKSSDAAVNAVGEFIPVTLWEALKVEVLGKSTGTDRWITAWANIYSDILPSSSVRMSNVVIPLISVASGNYFWGQTWGPCFGRYFGTKPGETDNDREVYFHIDGALIAGSGVSIDGSSAVKQRAGFIITNTSPWTKDGAEPDEAGGDQFYMLQLSP